jgi:ATP-dependent DNA helicase PIF1
MRLLRPGLTTAEAQQARSFADWVLKLGGGVLPGKHLFGSVDADWIEIPSDLLRVSDGDKEKAIVDAVSTDLHRFLTDPAYLRDRAVVTQDVDVLNNIVLDMVPGELKTYLSADSISASETVTQDLHLMFPIEYLNTLAPSGVPPHALTLQIGRHAYHAVTKH